MRCKKCRDKFEPKVFLQKFCMEKDECIKEFVASAKVATQKNKKQEYTKERVELKKSLMTLSDWKKLLQIDINTIVRIIDFGHLCISSRKSLNSKYDAGHFYSSGSNPSIRFNLFNIYAQSVHSNQHLSGDQINFLEGIETDFGFEHKEYVLSLKKLYPILKINSDEIEEKIPVARSIIKWLKLQDRKFTTEERLSLRTKFNEQIGIY